MSKLHKCSVTAVFISVNNFLKLEHDAVLPTCSSNYDYL